jgi:hypothetical protein
VSPANTVVTRNLPRGISFTGVDTTTFFAWGLTESASIGLQQGARVSVVRMTSGGEVEHD